jgi:DNA (cytosine-5)-methyltransferase 1
MMAPVSEPADNRPCVKPRLLDLFCGAGGAARGYQDAGFYVVGVDIAPQPHYCGDDFHQADALTFPPDGFDAIHASPPCQAYSAGKNMWHGRLPADRHPDLIASVRARLAETGLPYVIENVEGAPVTNCIMLCGDMFGLGVKRHRWFETSFMVWNPPACRPDHPRFVVSVFGGGALSRTPPNGSRENFMQRRVHVAHAQAQEAMGISWMTRDELSQAIPPVYTHWVGDRLVEECSLVRR